MIELKTVGLIFLVFVMANQECEGPDPEPEFVFQTEFVDIIVIPDTVAVGDTVLVHAVIKDSSDTNFIYTWTMNELIPVDGEINSSRVKWKAEKTTNNEGEVVRRSFAVEADNGDKSKEAPIERFEIYIKH